MLTSRLSLRRATESDAAGLAAVHVASWRETYAGIMPDAMLAGLSVEARAETWRRILGDPSVAGGTGVYIVEDQGRIVGFGSCGEQRDRYLADLGFDGEISAIYVLQSHQGRGVGRAVVREMAAALQRRAHEAVTLWVLRENAIARGFYEHLGGAVIAEKKDERPGATLTEVAYGWRDLARLVSTSDTGAPTQ